MSKERAKQPNSIVEAAQYPQATKNFLDVLDAITGLANNDDDIDRIEYSVNIKNNYGLFGASSERIGKQIISRAKEILKSEANYFETDTVASNYIGTIEIKDPNHPEIITFTILPAYKKLLIEEKGFVTYTPSELIAMRSKYSGKMFKRLVKHSKQAKIEFTGNGTLKGRSFTYFEPIEQFRMKLGLPEKYKLNDVKSVCMKIMDDIAEHTGYTAEVYYNLNKIKDNTKPVITHIAWEFIKKNSEIIEADYEEHPAEEQEKPVIRKRNYFNDEEMNSAFIGYIDWWAEQFGRHPVEKTVSAWKKKLEEMSGGDRDLMIRSIDRTVELGFRQLYDIRRDAEKAAAKTGGESQKKGNAPNTRFNNFHQREYDFDKLENQLFNK